MTKNRFKSFLINLKKDWRIGEVALQLQAQIQNLTTPQLEELGVALLDFNNATDLAAW
ncbi:DUF4351 domain-containing protein [Chroococcidiopsis sp. FACHB-1243]|uniref:DUF4351 domain-containing protein n=1 Tax=Chroococcidiopsis sp. [FACHB-1243] TaxID=2692781 RepID=UPI0017873C73|nr:DUF4351 domain-containing protein [Chroococcidiopsis sp. [FACHB-1243]]